MSKTDNIQEIIELIAKLHRPASKAGWHELGLSHAQVGMLYLLSRHEPSSVKQTADFLGISKSAVSQLTDPLSSKGLIDRRPDDQDRRIIYLSLSSKGHKLMKRLAKHKFDGLRSSLQSLNDKDIDSLLRLMRKASGGAEDGDG